MAKVDNNKQISSILSKLFINSIGQFVLERRFACNKIQAQVFIMLFPPFGGTHAKSTAWPCKGKLTELHYCSFMYIPEAFPISCKATPKVVSIKTDIRFTIRIGM